MPKFPDILLNNNPDAPSVDLNDLQVKGIGVFADAAARDALNANLHTEGYLAVMKDSDTPFIYTGGTWTDAANWSEVKGEWVADTNGINYQAGNVGIGGASDSTAALTVSGSYGKFNNDLHVTGVLRLNDTLGDSVIIGNGAGASLTATNESVIIGHDAADVITNAQRLVAIGGQVTAAGYAVAIGYDVTAGNQGVSIGMGAGPAAVAIGTGAGANNTNTLNTMIGAGAGSNITSGQANLIVGHNANAVATNSGQTVLGAQAVASGTGAIAIGRLADSTSGVAIGQQSKATSGGISMGFQAGYNLTTGTDNIILGTGNAPNLTTGDENIIIGKDIAINATVGAEYNNTRGIFIGTEAGRYVTTASQGFGTFIGYRAGGIAQYGHTVAIGPNTGSASGGASVMIGESAGNQKTNFDLFSTIVGREAQGKTAFGASANAGGSGTALGQSANATGNRSIAIGTSASATGSDSVAIKGTATGVFSTTIGGPTGANSVQVGRGLAGAVNNSVMLGAYIGTYGSTQAGGLPSENVMIGNGVLWHSATANAAAVTEHDNNVFIGNNTVSYPSTAMNNNVVVGDGAYNGVSTYTSAGSDNVILGSGAGAYVSTARPGSGNVLIGRNVGRDASIDNKLYIDNSDTTTPLVYGEFDNDILRVNGTLQINDPASTGYAFPTATGTEDQVLKVDANGDLVFGADGIYPWESTADSNGNINTNLSINPTGQSHHGNIGIGRTPIGGSGTLAVNGLISTNSYVSATAYYVQGTSVDIFTNSNTTSIRIGKGAGNSTMGSSNHLIGSLTGNNLTATDEANLIIGAQAGRFASGDSNVFLGDISGHKRISSENVGVGVNTLRGSTTTANNTGGNNVAVGHDAGRNLTSGGSNVFMGKDAGYSKTTQTYNIIIGTTGGPSSGGNTGGSNIFMGRGASHLAGNSNTTGIENVFLGVGAGQNNTTGSYNVVIGSTGVGTASLLTGQVNVAINGGMPGDGSRNVAILGTIVAGSGTVIGGGGGAATINSGIRAICIGDAYVDGDDGIAMGWNAEAEAKSVSMGHQAGRYVSGSDNISLGQYASHNVTGTRNISIGSNTLGVRFGTGFPVTSSSNIAVGYNALSYATDNGEHNIALGEYALGSSNVNFYRGADSNNVGIGYRAGVDVNGSGNVFLGYRAGPGAGQQNTISNKLYINNAASTAPLVYGEFDNDLLRVNGSLYVEQEHVYKQRHKTVATGHVGNQTTDSTNNTIHVETYYTRSFEGDGIATSEYTGTGSRRIYYSNKFNADPTTIDSNDNPDGWEVVDFLDVGVDSSNDPQQFNTFVNTFAASKASLTEQIQSYEHIEGQFSIAVAVIPTKLSITTTGANEVFKFNVQPEANGTATSRCPYALCTVNWGDGTSDTVYAHRVYGASNSYFINQSTAISIEGTLLTAVTFDDAVWNHTYATAGNYTVTITGGVQGLSFYQNTQITSINFGNQVRFGTYTFKDSSIQTFKGRLFYTQAKDRTGDRSPNSILEGCSSLAANQNIDNWFSPTNKEYANEFLTRYWSSTGAPANLETLTAGKNIKVTNPQIANWRPTNGLCPGINFDWTEVTAVFARSMELTRFPMAEGLEPKAENVISLDQSFSGSTYDMGDEMVRLSKNRPYVTSIWRAFQSTAWSHYGTWRTGKGFTGGETHGSGGGASNYTTPGVFIPWFIVPGGYGTAEQTTSETTNGRSFIKGNFDTDLTHMGLVIGRYNNLSNAFSDNAYYSGKGIENWDVSNVTNMQNLFLRASSCTPDISRWDVSSVTTMANIFWGATRFNSDISDWDVSSLVDAESMFLMAVSFNQDISRWDTSSVIDAKKMFCLADNGYWQGQTGAYRMKFDQNVGTKTASRKGTSSDAVYAAWDMSSVTTMNSMFAGFGTYKADFNNGGSDSIQYWDTSSVVTDGFKLMFYNAHKFNQPLTSQTVSDIEGLGSYTSWDVSNATDFESMFQGCDVFNQDLSTWRPTSATNFKDMFENAISFNGDVSDWVVASTPITSFNGMFRGATSFTGTGLNTWVLPTGNDFVMNLMFLNNTSLTGDITSWVTTRCTNMESMFQSSSFDQDISGWDTSNVTTMKQMFYDADSFNQDIGGWDISSIPDGAQGTNDNMYSMFAGGGSGGITGMSQANISSILVAWEAKVAAGNGPINMRIGRIPHSTNLTAAGQTAKTTLENTHGWLFS